MFCTYCKQTRVENEAPCPHCGAPSPLLEVSGIGQWGTNNSAGTGTAPKSNSRPNSLLNSWGKATTNKAGLQATEEQWEQASTNQPIQQNSPTLQQQKTQGFLSQWGGPASQQSFDNTTNSSSLTSNWSQMSPAASSLNIQAGQGLEIERPATSQSLLPVIYQGDPEQMGDMRQSTVSLQLIPQQAIEHLLPEIADAPEGVYVPPLFTKPRPLIPKYRVISGSLSVLIVVLMLCGGAGYYAQASGALGSVVRLFTGAPPPQITNAAATKLPPPPDKIDFGPAKDIISGTTTLHINANYSAVETDKVFTVNQPFYVTYNVQPPSGPDGTVTVKWYMNGQFYLSKTSNVIKGGSGISSGSAQLQYAQPTEGTAEIYWNNDLGERFYFVVEPAIAN